MEGLSRDFWKGRRVFVTGHTGFKGGWLSLWLAKLGASVHGFSKGVPTIPSFFDACGLERVLASSVIGDVTDAPALKDAMRAADPEMLFHLAAQPIVRKSYRDPAGTYAENLMGTVNALDALRLCPKARAAVMITTDKCYRNREWVHGYREDDELGGHDPYSASKACAELAIASFRQSFFSGGEASHPALVASARAGNVIGGGDWAEDRLLPDFFRAVAAREKVRIRSQHAVRPWQHVLEPLSGYMLLSRRLFEGRRDIAGAWNFGPGNSSVRTVGFVAKRFCSLWGKGARVEMESNPGGPHEAKLLSLDISKARWELGWEPRWDIETALEKTVAWAKAFFAGKNMREFSLSQMKEYGAL